MKQHPLQTAGRVRLPYTRRRSDARCVTSLSRLPDVPELKSYDHEFFAGHALLLVTDTTASHSPYCRYNRRPRHGAAAAPPAGPEPVRHAGHGHLAPVGGGPCLLGRPLLGGSEPRPPPGAPVPVLEPPTV